MNRGSLIALGLVAGVGVLALSSGGGGGSIVDLTGRSPRSKRKSTRKWSKIRGITLHQVGVSGMGRSAWPKVTSHLGVHTDGTVYLIHPLQSYLWASHGLNRDTIAIEVAGNFVGDESKPNSYWKGGGGPDRLNSAQRAGIRRAIAHIISQVRRNGGKIDFIFGHRQASDSRGVDPGAEIWREGGLWAQRKYGLSEGGCNYTRGSGKGIPGAWDPTCGPGPGGPAETVDYHESEPAPHDESQGEEYPG